MLEQSQSIGRKGGREKKKLAHICPFAAYLTFAADGRKEKKGKRKKEKRHTIRELLSYPDWPSRRKEKKKKRERREEGKGKEEWRPPHSGPVLRCRMSFVRNWGSISEEEKKNGEGGKGEGEKPGQDGQTRLHRITHHCGPF